MATNLPLPTQPSPSNLAQIKKNEKNKSPEFAPAITAAPEQPYSFISGSIPGTVPTIRSRFGQPQAQPQPQLQASKISGGRRKHRTRRNKKQRKQRKHRTRKY